MSSLPSTEKEDFTPMEVGQSGRGSGRLSKWSRVRALVDAENFLGRGLCICARQYLGGLGLGHAWGYLGKKKRISQKKRGSY